MNKITFPILNLELNINKIAFTIFGIDVYWYAILIVFSIVLALLIYRKKDGQYNIKYEDLLDLSIILIPISFISARIYYVIFNIQNYTSLRQIINIKDGGLAIYGALIGGIIVVHIYCKVKNIKLLDMLDYIVLAIPLGQSIGRWGNFINVEAYGINTDVAWKMGVQVRDAIEYVHPTFLYESIATLIIFFILIKKSKNRRFSGEVTYIYIILYTFVRTIIEGLRIDSLMFYNLRISQILSIILCTIFCIILTKKLEIKEINPIDTKKTTKKSHDL
ncbi:MAG: prolipoprotein diacylglyceryl transferase [Clostridia bacterium]|jgi:phosphatidylglycerol:prolipoprotein diacylglycerol transferase|nr:prolipoprotein diacylglyceryl transferase [Clostridia bacterium]